jgi:hypothetical protein
MGSDSNGEKSNDLHRDRCSEGGRSGRKRVRLDLELAPGTAVEERAKHRPDHIFAVQMCSHLPAKVSIG